VPYNATSSPMAVRPTFDLTFPPLPNMILGPGALQRVDKGVMIKSVGSLHIGMIQDAPLDLTDLRKSGYRIQVINNLALGKDERVYLSKDTAAELNPTDPNFTRVRDTGLLDIVVDIAVPEAASNTTNFHSPDETASEKEASRIRKILAWLNHRVSSMFQEDVLPYPFVNGPSSASGNGLRRYSFPAITSAGLGAAPLPDWVEADLTGTQPASLIWSKVYVSDETCTSKLPLSVPKTHQILVIKRGGCSFSEKLQNIPAYAPSSTSLQLVVIVSMEQEEGMPEGWLIRPLLEDQQLTAAGLPRHNPIPTVMVAGGQQMVDVLSRAKGLGIRRRYSMQAQGVPIANLIIV